MIMAQDSSLITPWDLQPNIWVDPRNYDGNNTVSVNGTAMTSITNLGKVGSVFTQASAPAQPNIQNNIVNGNPVFRFSGTQSMTMAPNTGLDYAGTMSI